MLKLHKNCTKTKDAVSVKLPEQNLLSAPPGIFDMKCLQNIFSILECGKIVPSARKNI